MADDRISKRSTTPIPPKWEGDDENSPRAPNVRKSGSSSTVVWIVLAVLGVGVLLIALPIAAGVGFFLLRQQAAPQPEAAIKKIGIAQGNADGVAPAFVDENAPPPLAPDGRFGPPGKNAPPLEVLKAASVRFGIDAQSQKVKDIVFASQSQKVGHFWSETGGGANRKHFDLWDWQDRKRIARIDVSNENGTFVDLSPKGTRLLAHQFNPNALNIWSLPEGRPIKNVWRPYADQPETGVAWAAFLNENQLLTIAVSGRFDLWDANLEKPTYTIHSRRNLPFMSVNGFSRAPHNMALSEDRKTLALANGDGFEFFETSTGKALGKTASLAPDGRLGNVWAAAFSRDGAWLASTHNLHMAGNLSKEVMTIWNVADGKKKSQFTLPTHAKLKGPLTWISDTHLVVWDGNVFQGSIFAIEDGRFHRVLAKGVNGDHFARPSPDGRIWYTSSLAFADNAQLLAVEFPADHLVQDPAPNVDLDRLPRWYSSPTGIAHRRGLGEW